MGEAGGIAKLAGEAKARVRLVDLVGRAVKLTRRGREHVGLCPFHSEKTGSFTVVEAKGFYHCFGCGAHGDAIGWLTDHEGLSFRDAVAALAAEAGLEVPPEMRSQIGDPNVIRKPLAAPVPRDTPEDEAREASEKTAWARKLWSECQPATGTLVEVYLRHRGIDPAHLAWEDPAGTVPAGRGIPPTLRFHPDLPHAPSGKRWPAMVAAIQDGEGRICGVHRTFLAPDGRGKAAVAPAKMMAGTAWGGATRLARAGEILAIGEGIETALSVMAAQLMARGTWLPVWAALSLGNMAGSGDPAVRGLKHPEKPGRRLPGLAPDMDRPGVALPDTVKRVILLADGDSGDRHAADALMLRAAIRFAKQGRRVQVCHPPEGADFNDVLRGTAA